MRALPSRVRWREATLLWMVILASCSKQAPSASPDAAAHVDGAALSASDSGSQLPTSPAAVFSLVARGGGTWRIHVLDRAVLLERAAITPEITLVTPERIEKLPHWFGVLPFQTSTEIRWLDRIAGSWPSPLWLVTRRDGRPKFVSEAWRRTGNRWVRVAETPPYWVYDDVEPYRGGLLAVVQDSRGTETPEGRRVVPARLEPIGSGAPTPALDAPTPECPAKLQELHLLALPAGDVFAAGSLCQSLGGGLAVEHWAPGASEGKIERLHPPVDHSPVDAGVDQLFGAFVATSATTLWAAGRGDGPSSTWFERFDGQRWARETPPSGLHAVTFAAAAPDGTRWVVEREEPRSASLWHQRADGLWERASLDLMSPDSSREIVGLWAFADNDVWIMVTVGSGKATEIFRNRPAQRVQFLGPE